MSKRSIVWVAAGFVTGAMVGFPAWAQDQVTEPLQRTAQALF